MSTWREIEHYRKDAPGAAILAARLLTLGDDLPEWEVGFLESMARAGRDELSTRQSEKLLEIRDNVERVETAATFSVRILIEQCHAARIDLPSDDDIAWIESLAGQDTLRRRQIGRLLRLARLLNIIDQDEDA